VIDHLVVCALIEGRSCEKFQILAEGLREQDAELAEFYGSLVESEGNHYATYLIMARHIDEAEADARLDFFSRSGRPAHPGAESPSHAPLILHLQPLPPMNSIPFLRRLTPRRTKSATLPFAALLACLCMAHAGDWPTWRGPLGTGVSEEKNLPTRWSRSENVKWRVDLPEPSNSTPIIWGDRVFLTQAVKERRTLMCFDRAEGKLLWQEGVTAREKDPSHATNPYGSASPVTDGERVIASFASEGLFCYDLDGKVLWQRTDLGNRSTSGAMARRP